MPLKRRKAKARNVQITDEIVQLFQRCLEIRSFDDDQFWEAEGGRRHEYIEAKLALHLRLYLHPWECSPVDVESREAPNYGANHEWWLASWHRARELRAELMKAAGA